jgi:hypothetical protein
MPTIANTSFNGGEISPLLYNRLELEKRQSSLSLCENFFPLPQGGLRKRPGTQFLTTISGASTTSRMIAFRGSDGERWIIVINAANAQCYRIADGTVTTLAITWPLVAADLLSLRWQILNDVIYFVHPLCHPFQIQYRGLIGGVWTFRLSRVDFNSSPELDANLNQDLQVGVSIASTSAWANATSYTVGQHVQVVEPNSIREYTCIANHTSATATNRPGTGSAWRTNWVIRVYAAGQPIRLNLHRTAYPAAWANNTFYVAGQYVSSTPLGSFPEQVFICLRSHLSSNTAPSPGFPDNRFSNPNNWRQLALNAFSSLHAPDSTHPTLLPGAIFSVEVARDAQQPRVSIRPTTANSGNFSDAIAVSGAWTFTTFGGWGGIFTLQRSRDAGATWEDIATYESEIDANFNESFEEEFAVLVRIGYVANSFSGSTGITTNRRGIITPASQFVRTRYQVTAATLITGPAIPDPSWHTLTATALDVAISGTTSRWTENSFNRKNGFPTSIAIFQRRLIYAGTRLRPLDLWMSRIEDFSVFRAGTKDDDPIRITLAPTSQNRIVWLAGQKNLFIGTQLDEWVVGSTANSAPITPTNFQATTVTSYGSSDTVPAILVGDATIFLQRHDQRVREMGFVFDRDNFDAADLTRLADHLLSPNLRFTAFAWQESREPTLWCVVSDGTLRTLTYIRSERVFAWARHSTRAGQIVHAVVSATTQDDDEVYWLVSRNGGFTLERIPSNAQQNNESFNLPTVYDSQYTGPPVSGTLPALARWEDPDSGNLGRYTPGGDSIAGATIREVAPLTTPISGVTNYVAGIPIIARVVTLPVETPTETGTSLTRYKNAAKLHACLFRGRNLEAIEYRPNMEGEIAQSWTMMQPSREAATRYASFTVGSATALYLGWVEANVNLSSLNLSAELRHTAPTPCTITALVWDLTISPE